MTPTHAQLWEWATPKRMRNLWKHIETVPGHPLGCWLWTGPDDDGGYGILATRIEGKRVNIPVHRLLMIMCYGGDFPEGMDGHHCVCENKACCHPLHVLAATPHEHRGKRRSPRSAQGRIIEARLETQQ